MVGVLDNETTAVVDAGRGVAFPSADPSALDVSGHVAESAVIASLREEVATLRRRTALQENRLRRVTDSLSSAASLHRELCTSDVPVLHGAQIDVLYHPTEELSGDAYTIVRLDDHRVAIGLIDATGHGVTASILAAYAQQSLRGALRRAAADADVRPSEILSRVNRDVCDAHLRDCQFVAAVVAIYDERDRVLRMARGGTPYPIHLSPAQTPRTWEQGGPLLGAVEDAVFDDLTVMLECGDVLVMHTDGLEHALAEANGPPVSNVASTSWLPSLRYRDLSDAWRDINRSWPRGTADDDVTVIALRML